jgi:hypothetical protein
MRDTFSAPTLLFADVFVFYFISLEISLRRKVCLLVREKSRRDSHENFVLPCNGTRGNKESGKLCHEDKNQTEALQHMLLEIARVNIDVNSTVSTL